MAFEFRALNISRKFSGKCGRQSIVGKLWGKAPRHDQYQLSS